MTLRSKWQQMKNVFDNVEQQVAKDLSRKHGIGLTEYRALQLLAESPSSELRMQEIASQLGLNQSSVTRLVERMERNNYAVRDVCPNDKRGVYAVITEHGRKIEAEVSNDYNQLLSSALDDVSCQQEYESMANSVRAIVLGKAI